MMKNRRIRLFSVIILYTIYVDQVTSDTDRQGKILNYRNSGADGLNFEHIISLWNRSAAEEPPISQRWAMPNDRKETFPLKMPTTATTSTTTSTTTTTTTTTTQRPQRPHPGAEEHFDLGSFPDRFKHCLAQQQQRLHVSEANPQGQSVVLKCFKTELINKLHKLMTTPDPSIKLFNGYVEFEKIRKLNQNARNDINTDGIRKRYSSRVATKNAVKSRKHSHPEALVPVPLKQAKIVDSHANDYYENYQKMLKELVARKHGENLYQRVKRDILENVTETGATLQKTAKLFESGRKLLSEITSNLKNEEEEVENLTETILDPELVSTLNTFSRSYAVKLNFYPGISARMKRNQNNGVTFDLELDELGGGDDDDDEDEEEDEDDSGRDELKKKKKKKIKISKKTLKKLFPYLLIPFMIQAALLPFVLKFLLFVAIKALIAGKLALVLVAFNLLKNSSHKSEEDEYVERMAVEHYGYGNGEEYGAWVNRRHFVIPEEEEEEGAGPAARNVANDPYKAHNPNNPNNPNRGH